MHISYPTATILLGLADVKARFRYPRINIDLTGAFGFIADELYNHATAMVFGLTASASKLRGLQASHRGSHESFC